ncbi:Dyslexia-associated protein KIAA0319-like protein [Eumeta japonica]|uniref:Dyslexia-associated protein KIAA0319-like protein n=1 Tax=Eumeta variegata TaxID=151549 RepID=A0A4C1TRV8_EUMVA|nr:Dyslexia-associated protein KIAA0319-like protein [Eumeta japonica]
MHLDRRLTWRKHIWTKRKQLDTQLRSMYWLMGQNWSDILDPSNYRDITTNFSPEDESAIYAPYTSHSELLPDGDDANFLTRFINNLPNIDEEDPRNFGKYRDNNDSDMVMDATNFLEKVPCEVGAAEDCPFNAECIPLGLKTNNGICKCVPGTEENSQGVCVQTLRSYPKGNPIDSIKKTDNSVLADKSEDLKIDSAPPKSIQTLTVSIVSKEVQLPENEVTLAAYTIPDEKTTNSHYNYMWTLVDQPKGGFTGNMNQNGAKVTLTDLTEGQYRFKVTVNGTNAYGEGFANVTVLPPQRINKPPFVVVTPQNQTVKLPNSVAVLDGSASKDDDAIISWHWELISGPIGYQPPLQDGPTLVLKRSKTGWQLHI